MFCGQKQIICSFQTVKQFSTGEIGRIYKDNKWQEATVTFTDYGPGVRFVAFTSKGEYKITSPLGRHNHLFRIPLLLT